MTTTKKMFPGMTQEKIDNAEKAAKFKTAIKAAQKAMDEEAEREKQKLKKEEQQRKKAHKKYGFSKADRALGTGIVSTVDFLKHQLQLNAATFLIGSLGWFHGHAVGVSAIDEWGEERFYPFESRDYKQAIKDAYNPIRDGKFDPHFWWYVNAALILVVSVYSIVNATERVKTIADRANAQIDIMLEIEKLAKEHKMDPSVAKKIIQVAPDIVKNMSKDSRVYFDMIMDGKVSVEDENFLNIATAIMVGHLKTHPEDMERVMSTFDEKSIPQEVLAMRMQREKR